ncbi:MAG: hypothetical protein HC917_27410 [Richelia sp. SM2_1_7]|nr:hypothetical protein [Richelia sp. SM2_1_7]
MEQIESEHPEDEYPFWKPDIIEEMEDIQPQNNILPEVVGDEPVHRQGTLGDPSVCRNLPNKSWKDCSKDPSDEN